MINLFTTENAARLLIDHQRGTLKLARNIPRDEIIRNTRALARAAVATSIGAIENGYQVQVVVD